MAALSFSTDPLPEKERLSFWREVFGSYIINAEFDHVKETRFRNAALLRTAPGLSFITGEEAGIVSRRTRKHVADGEDRVMLKIHTRGVSHITQCDVDITCAVGEGLLLSSRYAASIASPKPSEFLTLTVPRESLEGRLVDIEAALMRPIPRSAPALQLLTSYILSYAVALDHAAPDAQLDRTFAAHVHDLMTLALGATRDAAEEARLGGAAAARLRAIKEDVMRCLDEPGLSIATVCRRQGVSARYVHMLFESEGVTFSEFVLKRRLERARHRLADPRWAGETISTVAFATGFNDLSHFNRTFRRHFGATPSEFRPTMRRARRSPKPHSA